MVSSLLYPRLSYDPESRHCAFGLYVFAPLSEEEDVLEVAKKWPSLTSIEQLVTQEQDSRLKRFINDDSEISYRDQSEDDENCLVISQKSPPLASELSLTRQYKFIRSDMHNTATPNLFIAMLGYGLPALEQIYKSFDRPEWVPKMHFDESNTLEFRAPFSVDEEIFRKKVKKRPEPGDDKLLAAYEDARVSGSYGQEYSVEDKLVRFSEAPDFRGEFITREPLNKSGIILEEAKNIIATSGAAYSVVLKNLFEDR